MLQKIRLLERAQNLLNSRLSRMLASGEVSEIDSETYQVRVYLPGHDQHVTGWLPVLTVKSLNTKMYAMPEIGEQVWCLFLPFSGLEKGIVLGATFNQKDPPPVVNANQVFLKFNDSATFYYDQQNSHCELKMPKGTLVITAPDGATFNNNVTINGKLDVSDNIKSDAEISDKTRSMSEDREIFNEHDHDKNVPPPKKTQ